MNIQVDWSNSYTFIWGTILECASALIVFPFKRKPIHILDYFLAALVLYLTVFVTKSQGIFGAMIAIILELYGGMLLLAIYFGGSLWKNVIVNHLVLMVSNVLGIGGFLIIPGKRNIVAGVVTGDGTDLGGGMLFVLILGIATIGTSFVARKIARPEIIPKREYIYKYCALLILGMQTCMYTGSRVFIEHMANQSAAPTVAAIMFWGYWVILQILLVNLLAFLYSRMEIRRLQREKKQLDEMIAGRYEHYRQVADENRELLTIRNSLTTRSPDESGAGLSANVEEELALVPLSGNLTMDSILFQYYKRTMEERILFDAVIEPLPKLEIREDELGAVLDCMLQIGLEHCVREEEARWLSVSLRTRNGMLIIKLEGNRADRDSYERYRWFRMPGTPKEYRKNLHLLEKIVERHHGSLSIQNRQGEGMLCVFLPKE